MRRDNADIETAALSTDERFLLVASLVAALFYLQASHRIDPSHTKQVIPPALFVLFLAIDRLAQRMSGSPLWLRGAGALVAVGLFASVAYAVMTPKLRKPGTYSFSRAAETVSSWGLTKSEIIERMTAPDFVPLRTRLPFVLQRARELTARDDPVLFLPFMAQAYYFADRGFATPFGWLNPGRFLESGSQQRFIHAMRTTKLVADDPAFSFDRRPPRNARAYGPELMRHLYTTFGIFDVIGRFVLLSNSPLTWRRQGDFDRVTRPMELDTVDLAAIKSRGSPGGRPVCTQAGLRVTHVNTLASGPEHGFSGQDAARRGTAADAFYVPDRWSRVPCVRQPRPPKQEKGLRHRPPQRVGAGVRNLASPSGRHECYACRDLRPCVDP